MIDRAFTKAEARYIPNGPSTTADMAHPTRTGDLVAFSYPPYQFDAETPGTLVAPSHFFGQHGYVPDVQDLAANINMRATFLAGGDGHRQGRGRRPARSTSRRRSPILLGIPEPQHSQGRVLLDVAQGRQRVKPISIVGLNDFHGQLDPTTLAFDGINQPASAAASFLATMFDEELAALPGPGLILAAGDNVGASPPNSGLLEDMPAIDVENAWGLDATSYGNHEFDYGVERLLRAAGAGQLPVPRDEHRRDRDRRGARLGDAVGGLHVNGVKVGVIGAELENTPELVSAGATAGLTFLAEAPRIKAESERLRAAGRQGPGRRHPPGHERRPEHRSATPPASPWDGPILDIADALAGHDGRRDDRRPHAPGLEPDGRRHPGHRGDQRRRELLRPPADGQGRRRRRGPAARRAIAKTLGVAARADVQAIVDDANAQTAVLRNQVIGTPGQRHHPRPDAALRVGDGQHGRRRDAGEVSRRRRRVHELRRAAAGSRLHAAERRRAARRDHLGRDVRGAAVRQPLDDPDADRRPARARRS